MSKDTGSESGGFAKADYGFNTTHWSVVLAAGETDSPTQAHAALEQLCRTYWFPLYAYVRRSGRTPEEAQDLTQEFFLRLIEKQYIRLADAARGKFRTFLLTSLKHFLINEREKARAAKRGSGQTLLPLELDAEQRYLAEPADALTPDKLFEKRWAIAMVERAQERLRSEYVSARKLELFDALKDSVWGDDAANYAELSARLNTTEGALRIAAHRMKERFRQLLREEVAQTAASAGEVEAELRYLVSLLRS